MNNDNSILLKKLAPQVDKALSDKRTARELETIIGNYLDKNAQKLTTSGPVYRTVFLEDETGKFFNILKINPMEVKEILKESKYIRGQWQIMNNPFNSVIAFCIRFFKKKHDVHMMNACITYLTLSMYPSLHYKYFKYEPNENIMQYTINILSNKYKIKNSSTIFEALVDTTRLSDKTYSNNLIRATDKDITDYIQAYKTRLNSMLRKLANAFYENEKKGLYLNNDEENNDSEDFKTADNDTLVAERITESVAMNLSVNGPDMKIVKLSAKLCDISVNELRNTTNSICGDKENREDMKRLTSAIVYLFIFDAKKSKDLIGSSDFVYYCLEVYKKANTSDKNINKIKEILDAWLTKYSATYRRSQRLPTLNNFRRALYTFMIFTIQQNGK